jgi:hypothetical protein
MARPITILALFFIAFNLFAGMVMATGVDDQLGMDAEVGGDDKIDEVQNESKSVQGGTSVGQTLIGLYNVLAGGLSTLLTTIFPGLAMLERAGVPQYWINFLGPIFSFIIAIGMISFLRGWGL